MSSWNQAPSLDRQLANRDEAAVTAAWSSATVVEIAPKGACSAVAGVPLALPDPGARQPADIWLGSFQGSPWFVRPVAALSLGKETPWRQLAPEYLEPMAAAFGLVRFQHRKPRCESCGGATKTASQGSCRSCTKCGELQFARQDPVVIVALVDAKDRLLVARGSDWHANRFSLIAGFVEFGESLEQACHREVQEEVGISIKQLKYFGSQPWPNPRSLMIGFVGMTSAQPPKPDGVEIAEAHYLTRPQARAWIAEGRWNLPGTAAISRNLIDAWLAGKIGATSSC